MGVNNDWFKTISWYRSSTRPWAQIHLFPNSGLLSLRRLHIVFHMVVVGLALRNKLWVPHPCNILFQGKVFSGTHEAFLEHGGELGCSANFHCSAGFGPLPTCLSHSWKVMFSYFEASKMPSKLVGFSYAKYRWQYLGGNKALPQKVARLLFPETML